MGWFDKSDKLIAIGEKVTGGIMTGIDKAWFTDQEKAQISVDVIKMHSEFVSNTLAESSIRSITRRGVAFGIIGLFSISFIVCLVLAIMGSIKLDNALRVVTAFDMPMLALMVAGFFFGSHLVRGAVKGK